MSTEATLGRCPCRNCDGPLEFETEASGQTVPCPHCGLDTTLYIPGARVRTSPVPPKQNGRRRILMASLGILAILLLIGWVLWVARTGGLGLDEVTSGLLGGFLAIAAAGLALYLVILWIVFPIFVRKSLQHIEILLTEIERNTRR
jgi:hypothetical protein